MKKLLSLFALAAIFSFAACSDDDDDKRVPTPDTVKQFVQLNYSGAKIRHSEYENNGLLEVEILHDSRIKDLYFNSSNEWVYTTWDVSLAELPEVVKSAVATAYPDYRIDDIDYEQWPTVEYYEIEIDKGNFEKYVYVTPAGELFEQRP
ncbi:MAG: PepSY-like domain-containing protein [Bacteroidaceae bacterium]|nr:PepSY-like domain-containing protein [Bacteroidaceae bacterium]